jgi:uncharacterized protein (DUF58 family)
VSVRPGTNGVRWVVAVALATPLAYFGWAVLVPLGLCLVVLAALAERDRRQVRRALEGVVVERTLPGVVGRDAPFSVRLAVTNGGEIPLRGQLRDEHPAAAVPRLAVQEVDIPAGRTGEYGTELRIPIRGRHAFGPVWIRAEGPRRLVEVHRAVDCPGSIDVLPETFASRERLRKDAGAELRLLDKAQRTRQHGAGTEFESLYPFRQGDDPRRIDWRATARQRTLVVRRFQVERHRDVMIIIDSGRLMGTDAGRGSKLDCAVDAALNLSRVVLESGDRCGVAVYDRQMRGFLPPLAGPSALPSLVRCVYDLATQWHESDFTPMLAELRSRRAKRTFLIIISDLGDAETSQRLCASLHQLQRQHLVLFAALRTPHLRHTVQEPVDSRQAAARKAVAFRLLRDRGRALHALVRGGVHVLDVEPRELTMPLVNQFVELRQRNLL